MGKKVRCPKCETIFVAEAIEAEKGIGVDPKSNRARPDDSRGDRNRKKAVAVADDFDENDDDETTPPSGKQRRFGAPKKTRISLTRTILGAVVLSVLVGVVVFLVFKRSAKLGSVKLEVTMAAVDIFIDGKKIDFDVPTKLAGLSLTIDLEPGTHEIKVTRDRFHPFAKKITVNSEKTETISVDLKRMIPPLAEANAEMLREFEGTWVVNYANRFLRVYTVTGDGKIIWEQTQKKYSLSMKDGDAIMEAGPFLERWCVLDGALRIDHFNPRDRFPRQPSLNGIGERKFPQELAEDARVLRSFQGKWKITYTNDTIGQLQLDAEGRLQDGRRLVRIKGHVLFDQLSDRIERLTLDGNQLKVEHYFPSAKYLFDPGNPQVRGTGVREQE